MRVGRRGIRMRRHLVAGTGGVAVACALVLAGTQTGYPAQRPHLRSGSAWLASSSVGQLTLLDGSSAEVAAQVQAAPRGDRLDVVQQAANAYAIDRTAGTIRRVTGDTFDAGPPARPLPNAGEGLQAFAGPTALYTVDTNRGVLQSTDPRALTAQGAPVPLAARLGAQDAALDDAGRLWVLDPETGDLIWIDHRQRHVRPAVAAGNALLSLAGGAPVVIDPQRRTATLLDPRDGSVRHTTGIDLRAGDQVQVSGSPHADRIYLAASRGVVEICDLGGGGCGAAVPLGTSGQADLGVPVETGGRLFVPDYGTGRVWIVDLARSQVVAQPRVLDPKTRFELVSRDGVVFYNDPQSEHAGVLRLDGGVTPVAKYDPGQPGKGLTTAGSGETAPGTLPVAPPDTGGSPSTNPSTNPVAPAPPPPLPAPVPPAAPQPPSRTGSPPGSPYQVRIVLHATTVQAGTPLAMQVSGVGGPDPTDAQWSFGDGATGSGPSVNHAWNAARLYQVTVTATGPGGQHATASAAVTVTVAPPVLVTVPDLVGTQQSTATTRLTQLGLTSTVTKQASNTVPAGGVIAQNPAGGTSVVQGSTVALTVSSGKRAPFSLISNAPNAVWQSGAGSLPFNGKDDDQRGFAIVWSAGSVPLEDGSSPQFLETHPQWVDFGYITGTYPLPAPVLAGDHFRATVGFIAVASPPSAGDATFVVDVVMPNGAVHQVASVHDLARDGILRTIDADLSGFAGAVKIQLHVDAGASSAQDWASWIAPRVEG